MRTHDLMPVPQVLANAYVIHPRMIVMAKMPNSASGAPFVEPYRRNLANLLKMDRENAPECIVVVALASFIRSAFGRFGKDLAIRLAEGHISDIRQRYGLCHYCDNPIPVEATHPPICPICEAAAEAVIAEIDKDMTKREDT